MYLYDLPTQKKNVPELIKDPVALIKDVRSLVERHCKDSPELAITGKPILHPDLNKLPPPPPPIAFTDCDGNFDADQQIPAEIPDNGYDRTVSPTAIQQQSSDGVDVAGRLQSPPLPLPPIGQQQQPMQFVSPQNVSSNRTGPRGPYKKHNQSTPPSPSNGQHPTPDKNASTGGNGGSSHNSNAANNAPRRRRTRCKICEACQRSDCGECSFCLDMVKFGGPGRAKQTCMMRQCLQPMLPVTAQCVYCSLDGWRQVPISPQTKMQQSVEGPSALMECSVCYEISHPECAQGLATVQNTAGVVNEDLPNSWECPTCCILGKNNDYKVSVNNKILFSVLNGCE